MCGSVNYCILGCYLARVVLLLVIYHPIPQINPLPVWVIPWEESVPIDFELVREDEVIFLPIKACAGLG